MECPVDATGESGTELDRAGPSPPGPSRSRAPVLARGCIRSDTPHVVSSDNVEIARRGLEAAALRPRPDFDTMNAVFDRDHEFVSRVDALEGRSWRGGRGYRRFLANAAETIEDEWSLVELSDLDDDHVLAQIRITGHGKLGGAPFEQQGWCLMTVRAGKVTRTEVHASRQQAIAAAGLAE
jgi:ketosteroid isomerase-like protein